MGGDGDGEDGDRGEVGMMRMGGRVRVRGERVW